MSEAKYYLNANVFSNSTGSIHAIMGTPVIVLSKIEEHVQVVNVEDLYGYRFPVSVDKLSADPIPAIEIEQYNYSLEQINQYKLSFVFH